MLCNICQGRTFSGAMMHMAAICQHPVPSLGLKYCEECAEKLGVCEACGRQVPKEDADDSEDES